MDISLQKISNQSAGLEKETSILKAYHAGLSRFVHDTQGIHPEGFLALVDDSVSLEKIKTIVSQKTEKGLPNTVFVIGIGGANLATKSIYDAVIGYGDGVTNSERRMLFLDALDESISEPALLRIEALRRLEDFVVVIVSKSGKTIETIANGEFLLSHLDKKFGNISDRVIVVGSLASPLVVDAQKNNVTTLLIPDNLSDRFSAFSATTILPLALFGFLYDEFLAGARGYRDHVFKTLENESQKTALHLFDMHNKGASILDLFFFSPRLETLGKWQRQLIAESLGKINDEGLHTGITPVVSIGTVDLHSLLQLVLGGPQDKVTHFIKVKKSDAEKIGDSSLIQVRGLEIEDKTPADITHIILDSVLASYKEHGLPFVLIEMKDISVSTIGAYMMYAMLQTLYLGKLLHVDSFDQPDVEWYKKEARRLLGIEEGNS